MKKKSEKPKEKWLKNKNLKDLKHKENIWKNKLQLEKQQLPLNEQILKENYLNLERRKDMSKKELVFFKNNRIYFSNKNVLVFSKSNKNVLINCKSNRNSLSNKNVLDFFKNNKNYSNNKNWFVSTTKENNN